MSTLRFIGTSANIKQVNTLTIALTWAQNDTLTLTCDNIDFVITIGTLVTTAQVATTIQQALSGTAFTDTSASCTIPVSDGGASLIPEFSEFTASVSGSVVTLTANGSGALAGKPFTITVTGDGTAGNGTATMATTVTPTSQYHANQADNFSANGTLSNNDTLVFDNSNVDMRYLLTLGVQLATINKFKTYTGNVGLSEVNTDNNAKPYHEYRTPTYLTTNDNSVTTTLNYELGSTGQGSGRFKWDAGAGQALINAYGKGTRAETGVPVLLFKGSHVSNVVNNLASDIGIAFYGSETAVIATLTNGDGPQSVAYTYCGSGVTNGTIKLVGGNVVTNSAITTATVYGGTLDHYSGTVTTLTLYLGGTVNIYKALTVTTATIYGKIDLSKSTGTVTFTNLVNFYPGSELYDPNGKALFSAGFKLNGRPDQFKITRPAGDTITYS